MEVSLVDVSTKAGWERNTHSSNTLHSQTDSLGIDGSTACKQATEDD
jgi:hypothetical protein